MRIAVSGAGGFVGRHLVGLLEAGGHEVLPIARGDEGELLPPHPDERADAIVHLAFPTAPSVRRARPVETLGRVVQAAASVVSFAESLGARQLVLASTGKVYGHLTSLPIFDSAKPQPTTLLGELKLVAENVVAAGTRALPTLGATSLRIFNAYGPGQSGGFLVPTLLAGLQQGELVLGELEHGRDWVHVRDVVSAVACVLEHPGDSGSHRVFNVGTGRATTVRRMLEILRAAGVAVPEPQVDPNRLRSREADEERAASEGLRALGWRPEVTLEQGLLELLAG